MHIGSASRTQELHTLDSNNHLVAQEEAGGDSTETTHARAVSNLAIPGEMSLFEYANKKSLERRDEVLGSLNRENSPDEEKMKGPAIPVEGAQTSVVIGNTVVVVPNGTYVRPADSPDFHGGLTLIDDPNAPTSETYVGNAGMTVGGGLFLTGAAAGNLVAAVVGAVMFTASHLGNDYDVGQSAPGTYSPGATVTGPDGSVWTKQKDGTWTTTNEQTGVRTTIQYGDGDDPGDYIQTVERPYAANGDMCSEVVTSEYVDGELVGDRQHEYLDENGDACPIRPDGTLNSAADLTSSSFEPGDSFVDANGDEWTKQQNGTFTTNDPATRTTRTVDYGDGDDPQDYTYTSERAYDTDEGECTEVIEEEYVNGESVSASVDYLDSEGDACAVRPDGTPNPDAEPEPAPRPRPRPAEDGDRDDYTDWDGNDVGNGAGSDGDPNAGGASTF